MPAMRQRYRSRAIRRRLISSAMDIRFVNSVLLELGFALFRSMRFLKFLAAELHSGSGIIIESLEFE